MSGLEWIFVSACHTIVYDIMTQTVFGLPTKTNQATVIVWCFVCQILRLGAF